MSQKKRIIFTVINDLTHDRRMHRISQSLQNNGFEVLLVGRKLSSSTPLNQTTFDQKRLRCWVNSGKFFYIEYAIRLFFFLLFKKTDAYVAIDLDTLPSNAWAAKLKRKKLGFDSHEYFTEVIEVMNRPRVKKIWEKVAKTYIPKVDLAYTVNKSLAQLFEKLYNTPFYIIRNTPECTEHGSSKNILPDHIKEGYFVYVGDLNPGRGLEILIEMMPSFPEKQLVIFGKGPIEEDLKTRASDLGVSDQVHLAGWLSPKHFHAGLSHASIGFLIIQGDSKSYYYSLANKFYDYIHAGIPQITSDYPEYRSLLEQYEVGLTADYTVESVTAATQKLMAQEEIYKKLKATTQIAKKVFCWENEEKKLVDLYKNLFNS